MSNIKVSDKPELNTLDLSHAFEPLSDSQAATVSGGIWGFIVPAAVALGTSVYLSIKHKGVVVGYNSKAADGAQKFVSNTGSKSRGKFLGLF